MEGGNVIFNLNRRPFRDIDGMTGFVVVRNDTLPRHTSLRTDQQLDVNEENSVNATESGVGTSNVSHVREYRPALRSYFMYFPLFFTCFCLFVFAYDIWLLVLSIIGVNVSSDVINMGLLVQITQALAAAILLLNGISLLYRYYSVLLSVDGDGVSLRKGIVAREFISIRFSEIKTVGVKQGFLARVLNIGNLEFASSGSDGVDIVFLNVINPGATKDFINNQVKNAA